MLYVAPSTGGILERFVITGVLGNQVAQYYYVGPLRAVKKVRVLKHKDWNVVRLKMMSVNQQITTLFLVKTSLADSIRHLNMQC